MTELLLYVSEQSKLTDVIIWAILIAMLLFAIILLFWQRKVGESLS
jgi:hypothetical protein